MDEVVLKIVPNTQPDFARPSGELRLGRRAALAHPTPTNNVYTREVCLADLSAGAAKRRRWKLLDRVTGRPILAGSDRASQVYVSEVFTVIARIDTLANMMKSVSSLGFVH
jgi:hypothetical protein